MRITIRLDDRLHKEAKDAAAASGKTLSQFVEDALRETLSQPEISAGADSSG